MLIVLTGKMYNLEGDRIIRAEMQRLISRLGHQDWHTVAAGVDLLIIGQTPGGRRTAKQQTAEARGIPRISAREFFGWLHREDESLEDYVASLRRGRVVEEPENNLRYPGQRYQINGQDVTEEEFQAARARAARAYGRAFDQVQEQADREEQDLVRASMNQAESILASEMGQYVEPVTEEQRSAAVHAVFLGRTTEEALADPRREEVMADVRAQMNDNPAYKPYDRTRKIRVRKHTKADYN